jgi:translation initiation factor RLI1
VKIDGIQVSRGYGARIVGVYGVGGIGKTTSCKVLCNDYFEEFEGKVCHIEFGVGNKLSILQEILRRLTETSQELLKSFSEDEVHLILFF